uniref:uncharacterized protein LOC122601596 n=1 Tax=Erigeron canadensis TaxID=72917 RepID=UPI001CB9B024|nr:uncharacterized protein LOC122601596 [Erigeron canadensis]
MDDFEPPSFSLGFDFDFDQPEPEPQQTTTPPKTTNGSSLASGSSVLEDANDNEYENLTVLDSESDYDEFLRPRLKRLRRGYVAENHGASGSGGKKVDLDSVMNLVDVDDDDIEDFDFDSPQRNRKDEPLSTQHRSVCNSSKIPLNGHGVLTKQSGKKKQSVSSGPDSVITTCNKSPFPKLTVSPLRRFQLIDSDSDPDDPFVSEGHTKKNCKESDSHMNLGQPNLKQCVGLSEHRNLNKPTNTFAQKDLWEDFQPQKTRIPTPALDQVCEEYFSSFKDKSTPKSNTVKSNHDSGVTNSVIDLDDPKPPAHQYFFHCDPRVRELVRTRLPNFFPLNAVNQDSEQPSTSNIDYMGQFSHGEKPKQGSSTNKSETSARKNSRKSKASEMSQGFLNPKGNSRKEIPTDAGKRRVQADGQASNSGHWFTGSDGKRVYVSKNGQEHTGRAAYVLYKKESGGLKNRRAKKASSKKK